MHAEPAPRHDLLVVGRRGVDAVGVVELLRRPHHPAPPADLRGLPAALRFALLPDTTTPLHACIATGGAVSPAHMAAAVSASASSPHSTALSLVVLDGERPRSLVAQLRRHAGRAGHAAAALRPARLAAGLAVVVVSAEWASDGWRGANGGDDDAPPPGLTMQAAALLAAQLTWAAAEAGAFALVCLPALPTAAKVGSAAPALLAARLRDAAAAAVAAAGEPGSRAPLSLLRPGAAEWAPDAASPAVLQRALERAGVRVPAGRQLGDFFSALESGALATEHAARHHPALLPRALPRAEASGGDVDTDSDDESGAYGWERDAALLDAVTSGRAPALLRAGCESAALRAVWGRMIDAADEADDEAACTPGVTQWGGAGGLEHALLQVNARGWDHDASAASSEWGGARRHDDSSLGDALVASFVVAGDGVTTDTRPTLPRPSMVLRPSNAALNVLPRSRATSVASLGSASTGSASTVASALGSVRAAEAGVSGLPGMATKRADPAAFFKSLGSRAGAGRSAQAKF